MDKITQQSTPATAVLTADVKTRLGLDADFTDHDTMLDAMIAAATKTIEAFTNHQFMQRTLRFWFDTPPTKIIFWDAWPIIEITACGYIDANGITQTFNVAEMPTDLVADPPTLTLTTLPTVKPNTPNVFWVDVLAGYGASGNDAATQRAALPAWAVQAIHVQTAAMYENREDKFLTVGATQNGTLIKASEYLTVPFKRHW